LARTHDHAEAALTCSDTPDHPAQDPQSAQASAGQVKEQAQSVFEKFLGSWSASAYLPSPIRFVFADGGFAGKLVDWARTILATVVHVVRKREGQHGFAVIPRRWCVGRTLAWLTAHRRLARDYGRDPATSEAMILWAAINSMTSRIARGEPATRAATLALARPVMTASQPRAKRNAQSRQGPLTKSSFT
jgi:transposase